MAHNYRYRWSGRSYYSIILYDSEPCRIKMKSCPQCNTKCLNQAVTCDCGYAFYGDITAPAQVAAQEQTEKKFAEESRQITEAFQKRLCEPLTFWQTVSAVLSGVGLGLLGILVEWHQASRFSSDGYDLKSKKTWELYWISFGVRMLIVASFLIRSDWWLAIICVAIWFSAFMLVRWFWQKGQ